MVPQKFNPLKICCLYLLLIKHNVCKYVLFLEKTLKRQMENASPDDAKAITDEVVKESPEALKSHLVSVSGQKLSYDHRSK